MALVGELPAVEAAVIARYRKAWEQFPRELGLRPDYAFQWLQPRQAVHRVPLSMSRDGKVPPKPHGTLRFVAISDTHTKHDLVLNRLPEGDVLIHAGDFSLRGSRKEVRSFDSFLAECQGKYSEVVVIAGNHERTFEKEHAMSRLGISEADHIATKSCLRSCVYLEDEEYYIRGIKLYGSPWQPEFCGWAFNLCRGKPIAEKWERIPTDTDILITHGPPICHGDQTSSGGRAGCVDLLREIQTRIQPKFHVFGHIHEDFGATTDGVTTFINASTCDLTYAPSQPPIVFDVPIPEGQ